MRSPPSHFLVPFQGIASEKNEITYTAVTFRPQGLVVKPTGRYWNTVLENYSNRTVWCQ